MEVPSSVQKLNKRIGDALGRNPHGEPLYKWVYSEDFFHFMMDIGGYEEVFHPAEESDHARVFRHAAEAIDAQAWADWRDLNFEDRENIPPPAVTAPKQPGIFTMDPIYIKRKMCPQYEDTWLVAHWHEAEPEGVWRNIYGSHTLWPRMGYYTPCDAWAEQGQLPTDTLTDQLIYIVKKTRQMKANEIDQPCIDAMATKERDIDNTRFAMIDDALTAFGAIPGSRSGGVSFPMPGVDYTPSAQKGAAQQ